MMNVRVRSTRRRRQGRRLAGWPPAVHCPTCRRTRCTQPTPSSPPHLLLQLRGRGGGVQLARLVLDGGKVGGGARRLGRQPHKGLLRPEVGLARQRRAQRDLRATGAKQARGREAHSKGPWGCKASATHCPPPPPPPAHLERARVIQRAQLLGGIGARDGVAVRHAAARLEQGHGHPAQADAAGGLPDRLPSCQQRQAQHQCCPGGHRSTDRLQQGL